MVDRMIRESRAADDDCLRCEQRDCSMLYLIRLTVPADPRPYFQARYSLKYVEARPSKTSRISRQAIVGDSESTLADP